MCRPTPSALAKIGEIMHALKPTILMAHPSTHTAEGARDGQDVRMGGGLLSLAPHMFSCW